MPMMSPRLLQRGPPELAGLIAASVWITSNNDSWLDMLILRLSALTMPEVTLPSNPSGLPTAIANSPATRSAELPRVAAGRLEASILMTARSVSESVPTTWASYVDPSLSETLMLDESSTTWLL